MQLLAQPVPWAYFHLLALMTFITLFLVGYSLVGLALWPVTLTVHSIVCLIFMGLKNLAVAMADPFGDDEVDFNVDAMLAGAYKNAVAIISDGFEVKVDSLPAGVGFPSNPDAAQSVKQDAEKAGEASPLLSGP